jgi:hypothetical protein
MSAFKLNRAQKMPEGERPDPLCRESLVAIAPGSFS